MKFILIFGLFLLNATEKIKMSDKSKMTLFDKNSKMNELKYIPKQSKVSHEEISIDMNMDREPENFRLFSAWRSSPIIFGIILSFLGADLTKIIKLAKTKGRIEVIFRHFVPKSLQRHRYFAPEIFWKNDLDLRTIQIAAPKYFK
jgi:hypothetical protein